MLDIYSLFCYRMNIKIVMNEDSRHCAVADLRVLSPSRTYFPDFHAVFEGNWPTW